MKKWLALVILTLIVFPKIYNLSVYLNYEKNLSEYKKLCINKANEEMQCNGKCHLKIDLMDKNEPEAPAMPNYFTDFLEYFNPSDFNLQLKEFLQLSPFFDFSFHYSFCFEHKLFKPPVLGF